MTASTLACALVACTNGVTIDEGEVFTSDLEQGSVGWTSACEYSHSLSDDPIVFPGMPGASHLHDFFGATTTNAYSTYRSLRSSPTTCEIREDTSAYWVPALYVRGVRVLPQHADIYYFTDVDPATIEPFPSGMRIIAGNAHATEAQQLNIAWYDCGPGDGGGLSQRASQPYRCNPGYRTRAHLRFPSCWDGVRLTSSDQSHVVYPNRGVCPPTHPRPLPQLSYQVAFPVDVDLTGATLASGAAITLHADFFNAWQPARLAQLVDECTNAGIACGGNVPPPP